MSFLCQKQCYLKKCKTVVTSCTPAKCLVDKKENKCIDGFEVILEDTVLFPEGGGQPDDRGKINGTDVLKVWRKGAHAIHFVMAEQNVGQEVEVEVDWQRRFDNMQQHSGQHLITAIAESLYSWPTTSWDLGEKVSTIELDTVKITDDQLLAIESAVNEQIRNAVPVKVRLLESGSDEMETIRSRGLPDDHVGPVRVVEIQGIDSNMCCGTHVSNLSHLQSIKLLGLTKAKKGKSNVVFVAGNRVLRYLGSCYQTEKAMTKLLKCTPVEQTSAVEKVQKNLKEVCKVSNRLLKMVAVMRAQIYVENKDRDPVFVQHEKDGDSEFLNILAKAVGDKARFMFLTGGDEKRAGLYLLIGPPEAIASLAPKVSELLDGKGVLKNGWFQGKANKMAGRSQAELLLRKYITDHEL
ncbi:alanyl-tRNA editing protein Aarsd1-A-like isoform X2 [Anneissia japonica]|uniref:alanyl-tRNA editing protein Aarsd1-A-like isoform X1 n=1 Tax=Anneissia japonica TaxID=1529436 RepID=UPI0014257A9E|nr:alanyl-tRNA editing protein Aarsd1-A-like isoform X1 [Anneissia japonica]XP_033105739.1 alanyl-tRNA editing protein Aarsd1-A-like isoform X2 [Anneissia japonica]